ncbi:MAG: ABC transporter permease [Bacillota bacterium]
MDTEAQRPTRPATAAPIRAALRVALRVYLLQLRRMREYGANFLAALVNIPVLMVVAFFAWRVVFGGRQEVNGYSFAQVIAYYILLRLVSLVVENAGAVSGQTWMDINSGSLGTYLARPLDYQLYALARCAAPASLYLAAGLASYAAVAWAFGLPRDFEAGRVAFFLGSVASGFLLWYLLQFLLGLSAFWIGRPDTLRDLAWEFYALFSGLIIPNDFLPGFLRVVADALPFKYIYYLPISALVGRLPAAEMARAAAGQTVWIAVLFLASRVVWARGVRRFEAQGG